MEKNQKILLAVIGILLIVATVIGVLAYKQEKNKPKEKENQFKEEYESLNGVVNDLGYTYPTVSVDSDNPIIYTNEIEVLDIIKKQDAVIYFGFATDPASRNIIEPLLSAASSVSINKVYYLDILNIRDSLKVSDNGEIEVIKEASDNYKKLLKKLDPILPEYYLETANGDQIDTGEKRIYSPLVVVVKDGKILDHHAGVLDEIEDNYKELTKEQKEELFGLYTNMFLKISGASCNENSGC